MSKKITLCLKPVSMIILLTALFCSGFAEEMHISIVSIIENDQVPGIASGGLIPWGNGYVSFDVVYGLDRQNDPKQITASISYYAKNGRTAEEVTGWNLILNDHAESSIYCEKWYEFPDGQQTNYTNTTPISFDGEIYSCRLIPVLADQNSADQFPVLYGSLMTDNGLAAATDAEETAPIGFGYVNSTAVALRKEMNGDVITRLPQDSCVWVRDEKKDEQGVSWYRVNAGTSAVGEGAQNYFGWMKAEFIDAGEKVWHDIGALSCGGKGMIALRTDGSVLLAGHAMADPAGTGSVSPKSWNERMTNARQVVVGDVADYYAVMMDGGIVMTGMEERLYPDGKKVWLLSEGQGEVFAITEEYELIDIHHPYLGINRLTPVYPGNLPDARILAHTVRMVTTDSLLFLITDRGELYVEQLQEVAGSMPDWSAWTDITGFCSTNYWDGKNADSLTPVYAAVREDGSVLAWPELLQNRISGWTELEDIRICGTYVVGLKKNGTVVSTELRDYPEPGVFGWNDITVVSPGNDYCVGLKSDGTLVFAGDHLMWQK